MNPAPPIRILLADDHFFLRKGLASSLAEEPDCIVVAEARDGREAMEQYRVHRPDVTLMDIAMEGCDGLSALAALCAEFPTARILMFTVDETEEDIFRAAEAGACGYVPKSSPRDELLAAIRAVHQGDRYFPAQIARRLRERRARRDLTAREFDVLEQLAKGYSNKEIGSALDISQLTVRQHVSSLLDKLGATDRTHAVSIAVERGIIRLVK